LNSEKAILKDGREVEYIPEKIGEGATKTVYFNADRQSVICFYKDKHLINDPRHMARLEKILGSFNMTLVQDQGGNAATQGDADHFRELFCWPTGIVVQPRLGIMTPAYPRNFYFDSGNFKGKEKQGKWFSSPMVRRMLTTEERGHWLNYLQVCILIARAVRKMHFSGLAHSDLSSKNVLIDPPNGKCAVIDVDTLVVPQIFPPDVLGTKGYIAPEVLATQNLTLDDEKRKLPSIKTDRHALAVLIYEYLLRRHPLDGPKIHTTSSTEEDYFLTMGEKALFIEHPRDHSNRSSKLKVTYLQLGPYLADYFEGVFIKGLHQPDARPSSSDCEKALCLTADFLVPCGNPKCEEKFFVYIKNTKPKCPWCDWEAKERLPILHFYRSFRNQFISDKHFLVGWDKRPLNKWHAIRDLLPDEKTDRTNLGMIRFHQGQWLLMNKGLDSMLSPSGNPVPPQHAVVLKEGEEIVLSQSPNGRRIRVEMTP